MANARRDDEMEDLSAKVTASKDFYANFLFQSDLRLSSSLSPPAAFLPRVSGGPAESGAGEKVSSLLFPVAGSSETSAAS